MTTHLYLVGWRAADGPHVRAGFVSRALANDFAHWHARIWPDQTPTVTAYVPTEPVPWWAWARLPWEFHWLGGNPSRPKVGQIVEVES